MRVDCKWFLYDSPIFHKQSIEKTQEASSGKSTIDLYLKAGKYVIAQCGLNFIHRLYLVTGGVSVGIWLSKGLYEANIFFVKHLFPLIIISVKLCSPSKRVKVWYVFVAIQHLKLEISTS